MCAPVAHALPCPAACLYAGAQRRLAIHSHLGTRVARQCRRFHALGQAVKAPLACTAAAAAQSAADWQQAPVARGRSVGKCEQHRRAALYQQLTASIAMLSKQVVGPTCIVVHAGLALPAALLEVDGPGGCRGACAAHAVRLKAVAVLLDVQAGLGVLQGPGGQVCKREDERVVREIRIRREEGA